MAAILCKKYLDFLFSFSKNAYTASPLSIDKFSQVLYN